MLQGYTYVCISKYHGLKILFIQGRTQKTTTFCRLEHNNQIQFNILKRGGYFTGFKFDSQIYLTSFLHVEKKCPSPGYVGQFGVNQDFAYHHFPQQNKTIQKGPDSSISAFPRRLDLFVLCPAKLRLILLSLLVSFTFWPFRPEQVCTGIINKSCQRGEKKQDKIRKLKAIYLYVHIPTVVFDLGFKHMKNAR